MSDDFLEQHYNAVIDAMEDGEIVPFLGAGVNLCNRPDSEWKWKSDQCDYLPSGAELAAYLAEEFAYDEPDKGDLLRVSQYAVLTRGNARLYKRLQAVFAAIYPPTSVHRFFAALPRSLRDKGCPPYTLIVTTNYDDVLERAFQAEQEPFDLIYYEAEGENRGRFWHQPHDGTPRLIEEPNNYSDVPIGKRTVILEIHGAVDRAYAERSSFVVTEDHYIEYLAQQDIANLAVPILAKLRNSSCLFLGYSLRDWNLRVIFRRIWTEQRLNYVSWAIQNRTSDLDSRFWSRHNVELLRAELDPYVSGLRKRLEALPDAESSS